MNAVKYLFDNSVPDDKGFLFTKEGQFSHGDIKSAVFRFSKYLSKKGFVKGERVVIVADNSFEWVVSYLGTLAAGGVAVPLSTNFIDEQLNYIIEETESSWIIIETRHIGKWAGVSGEDMNVVLVGDGQVNEPERGNVDLIRNIISTSEFDQSIQEMEVRINSKVDMAAIMYTSGSTGRPRGVMISHSNITSNTESIIQYLNLVASDRMMCVLPFFYCFGTSLLHTHLRAGGSLVVEKQFVFPELILNRIEETQCTGLAGVPSNFQILLRKSTLNSRHLPKLRYVQQAGGKLPDIFIGELQKTLPHADIFVMYGQTEATARLSYLKPELLGSRLGSIGKGIPGVILKVLNGKQNPVHSGEIGEIVAQGDNIALGYWKDQEATRQTFREGDLYTGDLATVDEDGYIYIVDRAKDFLKCGGHRVSSKYIEEIVLGYPGVVEAAVIGQPDEYLGEAVRLCVVHPDGESIIEDLEKYCGQHLDWALVPRKIIFCKALPKNSSGKVDKMILKEEAVS